MRYLGGDVLAGGQGDTGRAAVMLIDITAANQAHHLTVTEEIQTTSLEVSTGTDPKFPPGGIVVEERGYKKDTTLVTDSGSVQSVKMLQIDNRYLMQLSIGRYRIADWDLSEQPVAAIPSPSPSPSPRTSPSPSPSPSSGALLVAGPSSTTPAPAGSGGPLNRLWFVGLLAVGLVLAAGGGGTAIMAPTAHQGSTGETSTPLPVAGPEPLAAPEAPADHRVSVRLMGTFALVHEGTDYALRLRRSPLQTSLFLLVLMLALEGERRRPSRHSIAEEIYPGQDPGTQDERMRSLIRHRKRGLPSAISDLILDDGKTLGFDLDNSVVDAYQLLAAAKECELDPELHSETLRQAVVRTLDRSQGRFLDFWEELVSSATGRRGGAEAVVFELRNRLDRARAELLLALGRNALWRKDPGPAIGQLEEASALRPDRDDVASALAEAYEAVGRTNEAAELRRSHGV